MESYPQQVSCDQANDERSEIAFSNGASISTEAVGRYNTYKRHNSNSYSRQIDINNVVSNIREHSSTRTNSENIRIKQARYPNFYDYSQRLRSFARWTLSRPVPTQLAEAGFFFTNQSDMVRCYHCGIGLKDFSADDNPLMEHVRHSGDCPFLLEYLGQQNLSDMKVMCHRPQTMANTSTLRHPGLHCRHPEYQTVQARVSSFTSWPTSMLQTPQELAESGFYYTGVHDQVRCFSCDGGLRHWSPEDDPWTEHCRWFPACPYAKEMKGEDFIALVQASIEYNNAEHGGSTDIQGALGQDVSSAMERLELRDSENSSTLNDQKATCLEMGFQLSDFNKAVKELRQLGNSLPNTEDILDMINMLKDRKQRPDLSEKKHNETPFEENIRLKSRIICIACGRNQVNALFLPCTHHRLCMECAEPLNECPVCEKIIRQKVKTYLA